MDQYNEIVISAPGDATGRLHSYMIGRVHLKLERHRGSVFPSSRLF